MKPVCMLSPTGSLRKAPLSVETLEICLMTDLTIVNFIIQITYIDMKINIQFFFHFVVEVLYIFLDLKPKKS